MGTKKSSKKQPSKKQSPYKLVGSPRSRRRVREMTKRVLEHCDDESAADAALMLGIATHDINNIRKGTNMTIGTMVKMVRVGRFDPTSIIDGPKLRKLKPRQSVRGAQRASIDVRIQKLARTRPGKEWAKLTGLSITGAYGLRYSKGAHVTLSTLMGFLDAGYTVDELVLGKRPQ